MNTKPASPEVIARREARKQARRAAKEAARIESERTQKPVASLTLSIEWKKSRIWGNNPHLTAEVSFHDGTFRRVDGFTCSGCGYDKESTVIASAFNSFLRYKLWAMTLEQVQRTGSDHACPYGISCYKHSPGHRSYEGGVGTSCYYAIGKYIGGKFEHIASGKTFDVYRYTDNTPAAVAAI